MLLSKRNFALFNPAGAISVIIAPSITIFPKNSLEHILRHYFTFLIPQLFESEDEAFELFDEKEETVRFTDENALTFWEDERICGIRNRDTIKMISAAAAITASVPPR